MSPMLPVPPRYVTFPYELTLPYHARRNSQSENAFPTRFILFSSYRHLVTLQVPEGIQKLAPKGLEEALPESIHPTKGANKKL